MTGIELCRDFYNEIIKNQLTINHGAALLGGGSEVLGFDTELSQDHDWFARCHIFTDGTTEEITLNLPKTFKGFETKVEIHKARDFYKAVLGFDVYEMTEIDWLTIPSQLLCELTKGAVFRESETLTYLREKLQFYPKDIHLYILAAAWERIGQEMAFMGRCGENGDETGSALLCGHLTTYIMRLCFLYEKEYAPYWKWFGKAFSNLSCAKKIEPIIKSALAATDWRTREKHLSQAYILLGETHNKANLTPPVKPTIAPYYTRPFAVPNAADFQTALRAEIKSKKIKALPRGLGAIDQISDQTDFLGHNDFRLTIKNIWLKGAHSEYTKQ